MQGLQDEIVLCHGCDLRQLGRGRCQLKSRREVRHKWSKRKAEGCFVNRKCVQGLNDMKKLVCVIVVLCVMEHQHTETGATDDISISMDRSITYGT